MKKKTFGVAFIMVVSLTLLIAQTNIWTPKLSGEPSGAGGANRLVPADSLPYNETNPPPLRLQDAYPLALNGLGMETNQFYCVSATCLTPVAPASHLGFHGVRAWTFEFFSTNGIQRTVMVYFDKTTWVAKHEGVQF
jgi:hypothetical protein